MRRIVVLIAVSIIHFAVSQTFFSQITINLPKLPKIGKEKAAGKTETVQDQGKPTTEEQGQSKKSSDKHIYGIQGRLIRQFYLKTLFIFKL